MAIVEYPYLPFPIPPSDPFPNGQTAWRPLAAATLIAPGGQTMRCIVCPDSGADYCLFPATFAAHLGLDIQQMPKNLTSGVGSKANITHYGSLKINLGYGIEFSSYVGFSAGMDAVGFGLLGQAGFFEYYAVSFYQKQRRFTIATS